MSRSALVSHVAAETLVSKTTADTLADTVFSAIADALARDETVAIAGFGRFAMRRRPERQGRNPQTGEPVIIAESKVTSFKSAEALRDAVNESRVGSGPVPAVCPANSAGAERAAFDSSSPSSGTFVAGRITLSVTTTRATASLTKSPPLAAAT